MQAQLPALDHLKMTRALLWLFFLADLAGIAWAVRVLVREARRHLAWHLGQRLQRRVGRRVETLELPEGFAVRPVGAPAVPPQRAPEPSIPLRPVSAPPD